MTTGAALTLAAAYLLAGFLIAEFFQQREARRRVDLDHGYIALFLFWPVFVVIGVIAAMRHRRK